jgi:hypothetical protein
MARGVLKRNSSKPISQGLFPSHRKNRANLAYTELFPDAIKGKTIQQPQYLPQLRTEDKPSNSTDVLLYVLRRARIAKKNTAHYFCKVYQALEGGTVLPIESRNFEEAEDGSRRQFSPDLTHHRKKGVGYTECKASSTRSAQFKCGMLQLRNYLEKLCGRIRAGDELPRVDYGFSRYGDWQVGDLQRLENGDLTDKLAGCGRDLLIAPSNLAIFMLMNSPQKTMDQTTSLSTIDEANYWVLSSGVLNYFHKSPQTAVADLSRAQGATTHGLELFLDELKVRQYESPVLYTPQGTRLKTFGITKFTMPERADKAWLKYFEKNYELVLEKTGVLDDTVSPF